MYYLIYTSFATHPFSDNELEGLLTRSQRNNQKLEITGLLYYFSHSFIQLIEGKEKTVKALYEPIAADTRHGHLVILKQGESAARFYPDWTMAYRFLGPDQVKELGLYTGKSGLIDTSAVLQLFDMTTGGG